MVATYPTERDRVKTSKLLCFPRIDHTLWWRNFVSVFIIAIGILHMLGSETLHFGSLFGCDTGRDGIGIWCMVTFWRRLDRVGSTAVEDKVGKFGNVRGVFVIDSVPASICGPVRTIPYCGIQSHWLRGEVSTHCFCPFDLSYGYIVNIKSAARQKHQNKQSLNF